MARATDADVRAYVEMLAETSTAPYISAATLVVDTYLVGKGLSDPLLVQIEIFLAAHYATLAVERGGLRRDQQGDSAQAYQTVSERYTGFNLTRFGQQAIALDDSGTLVGLSSTKNLRAQFEVVGDATIDSAS